MKAGSIKDFLGNELQVGDSVVFTDSQGQFVVSSVEYLNQDDEDGIAFVIPDNCWIYTEKLIKANR